MPLTLSSARRCARRSPRVAATTLALAAVLVSASAGAQPVIAPPFDAHYTLTNLGAAPGVPASYGGITFKDGDPNTLLIGGGANSTAGKIYSIGVTRNAVTKRVTGFSGTGSVVASAQLNDGGLAYGPGGVLFFTRYASNEVGQIKPGSAAPDKITALTPLGVTASVGGLAFVPPGYPGAGQLKVASYSGGTWYSVTFAPDGSGTFNLTGATLEATIGGGPEGIAYPTPGSPDFVDFGSVLVSAYGLGKVVTYDIDSNGDPKPATSRDFIRNLSSIEGAVIDPLTGDFLFTTYSGGQVIRVSGFAAPTTDLVETAVTGLPAEAVLKGKFSLTDTVENIGSGTAAASTTRYYLSADTVRNAGDKKLGGVRKVAALAPGGTSTGIGKVTVPASAKIGVYRVLACADDTKVVVESDEDNNCVATGTTIQIKAPDLVTSAAGALPPIIARGASFNVSDNVVNSGNAPAGASTQRYVLSLDTKRSASDILVGSRLIPALGLGASFPGTATMTVPLSAPIGSYNLLVCADDLKKVPESNEKNNCSAWPTKVTVN